MALRNLTEEEKLELEKMKKEFSVIPLHGIIENGLRLKTADSTTAINDMLKKIDGAIAVNKNNNM
jgi:hypothetical protein